MKPVDTIPGFKPMRDAVCSGHCPFCGTNINEFSDFKDELSLAEYRISGLCQKCQDKMFG
jgi:hypothetical protein